MFCIKSCAIFIWDDVLFSLFMTLEIIITRHMKEATEKYKWIKQHSLPRASVNGANNFLTWQSLNLFSWAQWWFFLVQNLSQHSFVTISIAAWPCHGWNSSRWLPATGDINLHCSGVSRVESLSVRKSGAGRDWSMNITIRQLWMAFCK